jgi:hypothetical protein
VVVLLVIAAVALAVAVGSVFGVRSARRRVALLGSTETTRCADLASLVASVGQEVGGGSFRQRVEVAGQARPDGEPLRAPESGTEAVWHRTKVTLHWEEMRRDSDGDRRWQHESRVESDLTSERPFLVADHSGTVRVDPRDADVDRPEQVVDRSESLGDSNSIAEGLLGSITGGFFGDDRRDQRRQVEEWVVRVGSPLFVSGEAADESPHGLHLRKPREKGPLLVSTRSESELTSSAQKGERIWRLVLAVSAVVAVGCALAAAVVAIS